MLDEVLAPFQSKTITPFAIALSGGGDSMALLGALKTAPGLECALIVDHGLRNESAEEAYLTKRRAEKLGVRAHILSWAPGRLNTGLQEKARHARYGLMGAFCRRHKIDRLLTAHHLGDQAETLVMRYDKGTNWRGASGMRGEIYAPLWPELAGVTLCRPLLSVPKSDILAYLKIHDLDWIEDPSNANRDFTRVRIRQSLEQEQTNKPDYIRSLLETAQDLGQARETEQRILAEQASQILRLDRNGFAGLSCRPHPELLAALLRVVSGTGGPIDRERIRRMLSEMHKADFKALTLAGTKVSKHGAGFLLSRDAVAVKGRKDKHKASRLHQSLCAGEPQLWDGRFMALSSRENVTVAPLFGQTTKLPRNLSAQIKSLPPEVRLTLPVWRQNNEILGFGEGEFDGLSVTCLAGRRLGAMLGMSKQNMYRNV